MPDFNHFKWIINKNTLMLSLLIQLNITKVIIDKSETEERMDRFLSFFCKRHAFSF